MSHASCNILQHRHVLYSQTTRSAVWAHIKLAILFKGSNEVSSSLTLLGCFDCTVAWISKKSFYVPYFTRKITRDTIQMIEPNSDLKLSSLFKIHRFNLICTCQEMHYLDILKWGKYSLIRYFECLTFISYSWRYLFRM